MIMCGSFGFAIYSFSIRPRMILTLTWLHWLWLPLSHMSPFLCLCWSSFCLWPKGISWFYLASWFFGLFYLGSLTRSGFIGWWRFFIWITFLWAITTMIWWGFVTSTSLWAFQIALGICLIRAAETHYFTHLNFSTWRHCRVSYYHSFASHL